MNCPLCGSELPVTLLRRSPSYLFEVDQTRYAVDREIANHIYVSY
ncbi:hypothetical protein MmTuc01_1532 [Methanosarcina mazei Tuc01]|uniref:Uncharacterized protein n=1 Tax=Methanosarcina mazei Tuc01 TaxID=1236903 RepID=M1P8W5_METMZ|nr:ferrous iron transport protein A [Methanosarcina mazei]AGF96897.1 hypothetical protein MmTuc01_1532 [Methanosarcina mazei Tuc01]